MEHIQHIICGCDPRAILESCKDVIFAKLGVDEGDKNGNMFKGLLDIVIDMTAKGTSDDFSKVIKVMTIPFELCVDIAVLKDVWSALRTTLAPDSIDKKHLRFLAIVQLVSIAFFSVAEEKIIQTGSVLQKAVYLLEKRLFRKEKEAYPSFLVKGQE